MKETDFDAFLKTREQAANAYVRGDGAKLDAIVPHDGTASFHSPRGDSVVGARAVADRYLEDCKAFHSNGTSHLEAIQHGHDGDLSFWIGFQIATVQIGDTPSPVNMRIRVTELFCKRDGEWKLMHRHADVPPK
jgi:ketosteroid isomerase-like protein